ncbi:MAG: histone deacetylase [Candidatus Eisenbacteria bacterium]|uniref:Histone deacetylase n=1 Tax=Eiseniibacteriota bacterium TaxID=2212470 RepID=A0A933SHA0_UNCEI|nr:histone deacetylase [Candidatus Eisenbacteria bacterium]
MTSPHRLVWSPGYACDIGPHVFPTSKYAAVRDTLVGEGLVRAGDVLVPKPPSRALLALVHERAYLDDLEAAAPTPRTLRSELPVTPEVIAAFSLCAAGTTLAARHALATGAAAHAGGGLHHAYGGHAEGFCYVNDLAVAAQAMREEGLARRVAIVDLDVHQGNGTASLFRGVPEVFTLSLHQERNYPMPKEQGDLDVGLEDGAGDDAYLEALDAALEAVWAHAPDLVLYQAGADPFHDDQLGGLALSFEGLERRDRRVIDGCVARGIAVAVTLGGGYARRTEDTVRIHATTCRLALEAPAHRRNA